MDATVRFTINCNVREVVNMLDLLNMSQSEWDNLSEDDQFEKLAAEFDDWVSLEMNAYYEHPPNDRVSLEMNAYCEHPPFED